jgi:hypothetical protein
MIHSGKIEEGHELSQEELQKLGIDKVCSFCNLKLFYNLFF